MGKGNIRKMLASELVYYWVKRPAPTKAEFVKMMSDQCIQKDNYKPYEHGMMSWEEYVEAHWQNRLEDDRTTAYVKYNPNITTAQEVRERIKERVEGFIGFSDECNPDQMTVTDECQKIPLPTMSVFPDFDEPKLQLQDEHGNPISDIDMFYEEGHKKPFPWWPVISIGMMIVGLIMYGIGVVIGG